MGIQDTATRGCSAAVPPSMLLPPDLWLSPSWRAARAAGAAPLPPAPTLPCPAAARSLVRPTRLTPRRPPPPPPRSAGAGALAAARLAACRAPAPARRRAGAAGAARAYSEEPAEPGADSDSMTYVANELRPDYRNSGAAAGLRPPLAAQRTPCLRQGSAPPGRGGGPELGGAPLLASRFHTRARKPPYPRPETRPAAQSSSLATSAAHWS